MNTAKLNNLVKLARMFEKSAQTLDSREQAVQNVINYGRTLVQETRRVELPYLARPVSVLWAAIKNFAGNAHQGANAQTMKASTGNVYTKALAIKNQIETHQAYPEPELEHRTQLASVELAGSINNTISATKQMFSILGGSGAGGVQGPAQNTNFTMRPDTVKATPPTTERPGSGMVAQPKPNGTYTQ